MCAAVRSLWTLGCQKNIAQQIIEKGGAYIFALKGNQGTLNDDVRTYCQEEHVRQHAPFYEECNKEHGRIEERTCWVYHDVQWLHERHPSWKTIKALIRIDSTRTIKDKKQQETRYYIASHQESPQSALHKIRRHWAIEHTLHWILDMSFGEDQSRIRKNNAPQIMAVIRHIALNLLQLQKKQMPRQSIKRLRKVAGWNHDMLNSILAQKFS